MQHQRCLTSAASPPWHAAGCAYLVHISIGIAFPAQSLLQVEGPAPLVTSAIWTDQCALSMDGITSPLPYIGCPRGPPEGAASLFDAPLTARQLSGRDKECQGSACESFTEAFCGHALAAEDLSMSYQVMLSWNLYENAPDHKAISTQWAALTEIILKVLCTERSRKSKQHSWTYTSAACA